MATKLYSATIRGIEGLIVSVEVNISRGLPSFHIVGLANASVKEARERVRAAIENSGFKFPLGRIVINLAPGDEKKVGSHLDLSIALGILIESKQISVDNLDEFIIIGELFLNGDINRVKGILSIIMSGIKSGYSKFLIPENNKEEASYYKKGKIYCVNTLKECINFLENKDLLPIERKEILNCNYNISLDDVIGQEAVKRALIISAIGKHNILLFGPPGSGKTMLAERLIALLDKPSMVESLEIAQIYNSFCNTNEILNVISKRPFRNPHHSINISGFINGRGEQPGEITLAHNGVLFLDEISEFKREVIEALREPLEKKKININKNKIIREYPCDFLLVAAMNMCKCGNYGGANNYKCSCSEAERKKYLYKISRPVLDRIDLFSYVERVEVKNNMVNINSYTDIKAIIDKAKLVQDKRYEQTKYKFNSQVEGNDLLKLLKPTDEAIEYLERIYDKYGISLRGKNRILKISRSIADYEGEEKIEWQHIVEALNYRKYADGEVV